MTILWGRFSCENVHLQEFEDAEMRTITSLWTGVDNCFFDRDRLLMQTLSINLARQQQGNLHFVTDSFGVEIAEELGWSYEFDSVDTSLNQMPERLNHIWAAGKLYAASIQKERHMQIDGDVLLFKPLEPEGEIFTQSVDNPENYRGELMRAIIKHAELEPESDAYNCGILGGDPEPIKAFTHAALDLCCRKLLSFRRLGTICSMIAEQYFLGIHCRHAGLVIHTLFKELPTDEEAWKLGYCHMQGSSKILPKFTDRATKKMQELFPEQLAKFNLGIGNVILAGGLR